MGLSITSRYWGQAVYSAPAPDGSPRATVAIRRHAAPPADAVDYRHRVTGVEDVEYLAWRFYDNSETWWRIADANPVAFPLDLRPGNTISVPTTEQVGRISRDRVFP